MKKRKRIAQTPVRVHATNYLLSNTKGRIVNNTNIK